MRMDNLKLKHPRRNHETFGKYARTPEQRLVSMRTTPPTHCLFCSGRLSTRTPGRCLKCQTTWAIEVPKGDTDFYATIS